MSTTRKLPVETPPPPVADRPRCPNCQKHLTPVIFTRWEKRTREREPAPAAAAAPGSLLDKWHEMHARPVVYDVPVASIWAGTYRAYGAFCSLKCCEAFANAAHRAGYRLKA